MKLSNLLLHMTPVTLLALTACTTTNGTEKEDRAEEAQLQRQVGETPAEGQQAEIERVAGRQQMMQMCPMQVEGTTARVEKLDDAVRVEFETTGEVDELRRRVQKMARMHNAHRGGAGMVHGRQGKGHMMQRGPMRGHGMHGESPEMRQRMMRMMAGTTVETEETEGGVRLRMEPEQPEQLDELHQMVQRRAQMMEKMERGEGCPMMEMMGGSQRGMGHEDMEQ